MEVMQFDGFNWNNESFYLGIFTVMCYNVLCDKYATRQMYGYCPSWALNWDYRKKVSLKATKNVLKWRE